MVGGYQYPLSAASVGRGIMETYTQSLFDESAALTPKQGASVGVMIEGKNLTQSAKAKLKANGWKYYNMEDSKGRRVTHWNSPTFHTLGEIQAHAKNLMGKRK